MDGTEPEGISQDILIMRKGFNGLSILPQDALEQDSISGHLFVFRGHRGDLVEIIWWDVYGRPSIFQTAGARPVRLADADQRQGRNHLSATGHLA